MKIVKLTLLVSTIVIFISCKKEDARVQSSNGNYIDKIYSLWDDGSGMDTMAILSLNYDNLKRVVSMTETGAPDAWEYFYTGNNMLPYKAIIGSYGSSPDTIYYTYNASGIKVRDSIRSYVSPGSFQQIKVVDFTYQPGNTFAYSRYLDNSGDIAATKRDTATLDANGNIVENWVSRYDGFSPTPLSTMHAVLTYDNHPHPFSEMNIFNAQRDLPFGETFLMEMFTPNNRLTQHEEEIGSGFSYDVTYSYEYNANGFPVKITTFDSGDTEITLITYRSL